MNKHGEQTSVDAEECLHSPLTNEQFNSDRIISLTHEITQMSDKHKNCRTYTKSVSVEKNSNQKNFSSNCIKNCGELVEKNERKDLSRREQAVSVRLDGNGTGKIKKYTWIKKVMKTIDHGSTRKEAIVSWSPNT